jgi:hypothetical protein
MQRLDYAAGEKKFLQLENLRIFYEAGPEMLFNFMNTTPARRFAGLTHFGKTGRTRLPPSEYHRLKIVTFIFIRADDNERVN